MDIVVRGRVHPPTENITDKTDWLITSDEAREFFSGLKGKPAFFNHDHDSESIGTITNVYRENEDGAYVVDVKLNKTLEAVKLADRVRSRELRGFSVGYKAWKDEATGNRDSDARPLEVSLCEEGAIPDTKIFRMIVGDVSIYDPEAMSYRHKSNEMESAPQTETKKDSILEGRSEEWITNACKHYMKKEQQDAEQVLEETKRVRDYINGDITDGWQRSLADGLFVADEDFTNRFVDELESSVARPGGRAMLAVLASVMKGNINTYRKERVEKAEAVKSEGLKTVEERKVPIETRKFFPTSAEIKAKTEAARVEVEALNAKTAPKEEPKKEESKAGVDRSKFLSTVASARNSMSAQSFR